MAEKKISLDNMTFDINYEIFHAKNEKDLIILHGWGSNQAIMKQAFSKILPSYRHIYIDMPGFGKSSNNYVLDTKDYAKIIENFLFVLDARKDIILGHSFGGKVAALLEPKLLVLLSNSGIPTKKPLSVIIKIKLFKILKNVGGSSLSRLFASKDVEGMSQNMYESFKKIVDEDFSDIFANYSKKAIIFWGKQDRATPLQSGEKVSKLIKNSSFYSLDGDHYFFLKEAKFIEKSILNLNSFDREPKL